MHSLRRAASGQIEEADEVEDGPENAECTTGVHAPSETIPSKKSLIPVTYACPSKPIDNLVLAVIKCFKGFKI